MLDQGRHDAARTPLAGIDDGRRVGAREFAPVVQSRMRARNGSGCISPSMQVTWSMQAVRK
jgi:hypothetical protein